jgi:hypothetical protein
MSMIINLRILFVYAIASAMWVLYRYDGVISVFYCHIHSACTMVLTVSQTAHCSKCKLMLSGDKFGKDKKAKSGMRSWCKQCATDGTKAHFDTERGRFMAMENDCRKNTAERIRRYHRAQETRKRTRRDDDDNVDEEDDTDVIIYQWEVSVDIIKVNANGHVSLTVSAHEKPLADFHNMHKEQSFIEHYLGIPYFIGTGDDFQVSPERLNPKIIPYYYDNTVLTVQEFNTPKQWNVKKFQELYDEVSVHRERLAAVVSDPSKTYDDPHRPETLRMVAELRAGPRKLVGVLQPSKSKKTGLCPKCSSKEFNKNGQCKKCQVSYNTAKRQTAYGFVMDALDRCKTRCRIRERNGRTNQLFELTLEIFIDMYSSQGGRCYYSGKRLELRALTDWQASIERLDESKGYTKDNVVLIAAEFQSGSPSNHRPLVKSVARETFFSSDDSMEVDAKTAKQVATRTGSAQWSVEKFEYVWPYIVKRYGCTPRA